MFKIFILLAILFSNYLFGKTKFYLQTYSTIYNSVSNEIVYDPNTNKKLSELIWETGDVSLLGLKLKIIPNKKVKLNLLIEKMLFDNMGTMNDYDWLSDTHSEWSDWSTHPNTVITDITKFNVNIQYNLPKDKYKNLYIVKLGMKMKYHSFKSYGGSYIYSSNGNFRNKIGEFNNNLGISYEETFMNFYIKGEFIKVINKLLLKASLAFSPIVLSANTDTHYLRSFTNNNTFNPTYMYEYELGLNYSINDGVLLGFNYSKSKYNEATGTTTRTYFADNSTDNAKNGDTYTYDGAGLKNTASSKVILSVIFKF
jgi:plasminogen activator